MGRSHRLLSSRIQARKITTYSGHSVNSCGMAWRICLRDENSFEILTPSFYKKDSKYYLFLLDLQLLSLPALQDPSIDWRSRNSLILATTAHVWNYHRREALEQDFVEIRIFLLVERGSFVCGKHDSTFFHKFHISLPLTASLTVSERSNTNAGQSSSWRPFWCESFSSAASNGAAIWGHVQVISTSRSCPVHRATNPNHTKALQDHGGKRMVAALLNTTWRSVRKWYDRSRRSFLREILTAPVKNPNEEYQLPGLGIDRLGWELLRRIGWVNCTWRDMML